MNRSLIIFLALAVLGSIAARLIPHLPNFAPIGALALFAGYYGARRTKWALLLPVAALFLSDLVIGTYDWGVMGAVYASFFAIGGIGYLFRGRQNPAWIMLAAISGSVLFYLTTNFAVWAFSPLYAKTFEGLVASYVLAFPFFRNTLLGDLFYTGVLFGSYEAMRAFSPLREKTSANYAEIH